MNQFNKFVISLYIIFSTFTTWLGFSGWLRFPVVLLLTFILIALPILFKYLINKPKEFINSEEDWLLIGMLFLIIISFFRGSMRLQTFNHLLSFIFVFIGYCVIFKFLIITYNISIKHIFRMIFYASLLSSFIIIVEWTLLNGFNIIIRNYFVFSDNTYTMIYYPFLFFKSIAGTCEEPSLMALNLNIIFPTGMYYVYVEHRKWLPLYVALYALSLFFTASAGGIGFLLIAYIATALLEANRKSLFQLFKGLVLFVFVSYFIYLFLPDNLQYVFDKFIKLISSKITLNAETADMRMTAWKHAIEDWLDAPLLGKGIAYGKEAYFGFSYQSVYLQILAETGIISLLTFLFFLGVILLKIIQLKHPVKRYLLIAFISGSSHLFITDTYYHNCLWIIIVLVQLLHIESNFKKINI